MRILLSADPEIQVPPSGYGGIQRIVDLLARELSKNGYTVGLVAKEGSTCPVKCFNSWTYNQSQGARAIFENCRSMSKAIQEFEPELVHSFSRLVYLLPAFFRNIPVIMSYQRNPGRKQVLAGYWLSKKQMCFSACSSHIANHASKYAGDWCAIPNCLKEDFYQFSPSSPEAPLVFLSRIDRIKGAHTACKLAISNNKKLILAGNITEEAKNSGYFTNEVEPYLDNPLITFIGEVNDSEKLQLLSNSSCLLLPIEWDEPFGIVYIEALACGTPVITANRGAAPEIITSGEQGYLCSSIEEYNLALQKIASIDRNQCRKRFTERYTVQKVCAQYIRLYDHCFDAYNKRGSHS